MNMVHSHRN